MMIALLVLGCLAGLVIYGQVGWILGNRWEMEYPSDIDVVVATVFWPLVALWLYMLWPICLGFVWIVTTPQRQIEGRKERKYREAEERATQLRFKEQEAKERAKRVPETVVASPAAEIAKLSDDLVRLEEQRVAMLARKAELERHPGATRH